jgi:hypothetical protein
MPYQAADQKLSGLRGRASALYLRHFIPETGAE